MPRPSIRQALALPRYTEGLSSKRALTVAVLLAESDPDKRFALHADNAYRCTLALPELAGRAAPSPFQDRLSALLGNVSKSRIYVGEEDVDEPSHCLPIEKGEDGLWRVSTPRLRPMCVNAKPGVFVRLPATRTVETDFATLPDMRRVAGGGVEATQAMQEVCDDYELRRMASHCYVVGQVVGALYRGAHLPLYLPNKGRVLLEVDKTLGNGWERPFAMYPLKEQPYHKTLEKPRAIFHADVVDPIGVRGPRQPRYILPSVRPGVAIEEFWLGKDRLAPIRMAVLHLLMAQIVPFVCVVHDDVDLGNGRMREVVVANLSPGDPDEAFPVVVRRGRDVKSDGAPKLHTDASGRFHPNRAFMEVFRRYIALRRDSPQDRERLRILVSAIDESSPTRQGYDLDGIADLFARHGVRLSDLNYEKLREVLK